MARRPREAETSGEAKRSGEGVHLGRLATSKDLQQENRDI